MNTARCNLNWKTCGHCRFGIDSHGKPYGSCDLVGFWGSLLGGDICLNAPPYSAYEMIMGKPKTRDNEIKALRETIEEIEEELNEDDSKPLNQIKGLILHAKFIVNKLCGDN